MRKPDTEKVISEAKEIGLPTEKAGRSLVWFDEFRDRDESLNKWFFRTQMNSTDITLNTDEKHVEVSGGKLRLHTYRADGTDASTRCTSAARNSHIQTPSAVPCRSVAFLAEAKH